MSNCQIKLRIFTYIKIEEGAAHGASARNRRALKQLGTSAAQESFVKASLPWLSTTASAILCFGPTNGRECPHSVQ